MPRAAKTYDLGAQVKSLKDANAFLHANGMPAEMSLVKGDGYYYFVDGGAEGWYSSSVATNRITDLTYEMLLGDYKYLSTGSGMRGLGATGVLEEAADYAAYLFAERTARIERGESVHPEEIPPETRVQWSEVTAKYPELADPILRVDFQKAYEAALRKRGLLGVLKGRKRRTDGLGAGDAFVIATALTPWPLLGTDGLGAFFDENEAPLPPLDANEIRYGRDLIAQGTTALDEPFATLKLKVTKPTDKSFAWSYASYYRPLMHAVAKNVIASTDFEIAYIEAKPQWSVVYTKSPLTPHEVYALELSPLWKAMGRFIWDFARAQNTPVELGRIMPNGDTHAAAVFKNPRGLWQISFFDENGPFGHDEQADKPWDLIERAWVQGYRRWSPGLVDMLAENFNPELLARMSEKLKPPGDGTSGLGLPGGRADEAHRDPDDFDDVALAKGICVEMEHTADPEVARQIAMDHLTERADYYDVLERAGLVDGLGAAPGALKTRLVAIRPQLAAAAQAVYGDWNPEDEFCEVGGGGICDSVASAMESVIGEHLPDVTVTEGGQPGDDHAFLYVYDDKEAFGVDIPAGVYERGGGYRWQKIPDVKIRPEDVVVWAVRRSDIVNDDFEGLSAAPGDTDAFVRELTEVTVAHLTRAFERAQVSDGRGGVLVVRADLFNRGEGTVADDLLRTHGWWHNDGEMRRANAYAFYARQFMGGATGRWPVDENGRDLQKRGTGKVAELSTDALPEARLGVEVWQLGRRWRTHVDERERTEKINVYERALDRIRAELNWPKLPNNYDPPPPIVWPAGELDGLAAAPGDRRLVYRANSFPHTCSMCGAVIPDAAAWEDLEYIGVQDVPADPSDPDPTTAAAYAIEMRNCACGTTLAVEMDPTTSMPTIDGLADIPREGDTYEQAFAKILTESIIGNPQRLMVETGEQGEGSSHYRHARVPSQNADWYVQAGADKLDQGLIREELTRVVGGSAFNQKRKEGRYLAALLESARMDGFEVTFHGAPGALDVPSEAEWDAAVAALEGDAVEGDAADGDTFGLGDLGRAGEKAPGWVPAVLKAHAEPLARLTGVTADSKILGCGYYGCVLDTRDSAWVVKITRDPTEGPLVHKVMQMRADGMQLPGIVRYAGIWELPGGVVWRGKQQKVYVIKREAVTPVDWMKLESSNDREGVESLALENTPPDIIRRSLHALFNAKIAAQTKPEVRGREKYERALYDVGDAFPFIGETMFELLGEGIVLKDIHQNNIAPAVNAWREAGRGAGDVVIHDLGATPTAPVPGDVFEPLKGGLGDVFEPLKGGLGGATGLIPEDSIPGWPPEAQATIVSRTDGVITVDRIFIPDELRGRGHARRAMEALTAWADEHGYTLALTPTSEWGASKARLEKFYGAFGFEFNRGRSRDLSISYTMLRAPR